MLEKETAKTELYQNFRNFQKKLDNSQLLMVQYLSKKGGGVHMDQCSRCTGSVVCSHTFQERGSED